MKHRCPLHRFLAGVLLLLFVTACNAAPIAQSSDPLIIYDWIDDIPQSLLDEFTSQTGIPVQLEGYQTQEEAMENVAAGFKADILVLDAEYVRQAADSGLIQPIDSKKLTNLNGLMQMFRGLSFDPKNEYSIPFSWGTSGIIALASAEPVQSWADLYTSSNRVAIWEDYHYTIGALLKGMGYSANTESEQELAAAESSLAMLSARIVVQSNDETTITSLLANGQADVAIGYALDYQDALAYGLDVQYIMPSEGLILWADEFTLPASSQHQANALQFIDFMLDAKNAATYTQSTYYATAVEGAARYLSQEILNDPSIYPSIEILNNSEMLLSLSETANERYHELWQTLAYSNQ
jgi:spermidine/putrescine transport system substrate-binding protein